MREDSPLGRVAFWVVTGVSVLWAAGVLGAVLIGVVKQPGMLWPALIALGPIALVMAAVVVDQLKNPEDRRYSRNVHE